MLVPNENYCKFEEWLMPLLDKMLDEQVLSSAPTVSLTMFGYMTAAHVVSEYMRRKRHTDHIYVYRCKSVSVREVAVVNVNVYFYVHM